MSTKNCKISADQGCSKVESDTDSWHPSQDEDFYNDDGNNNEDINSEDVTSPDSDDYAQLANEIAQRETKTKKNKKKKDKKKKKKKVENPEESAELHKSQETQEYGALQGPTTPEELLRQQLNPFYFSHMPFPLNPQKAFAEHFDITCTEFNDREIWRTVWATDPKCDEYFHCMKNDMPAPCVEAIERSLAATYRKALLEKRERDASRKLLVAKRRYGNSMGESSSQLPVTLLNNPLSFVEGNSYAADMAATLASMANLAISQNPLAIALNRASYTQITQHVDYQKLFDPEHVNTLLGQIKFAPLPPGLGTQYPAPIPQIIPNVPPYFEYPFEQTDMIIISADERSFYAHYEVVSRFCGNTFIPSAAGIFDWAFSGKAICRALQIMYTVAEGYYEEISDDEVAELITFYTVFSVPLIRKEVFFWVQKWPFNRQIRFYLKTMDVCPLHKIYIFWGITARPSAAWEVISDYYEKVGESAENVAALGTWKSAVIFAMDMGK